ncbi:tyrosine-type recombinase/integrase [Rhizobium leguminosarum]|uniref:tyrosine-type recombinase/integrase n=1 Tax=Rhizobium leguminosarum TaxID=384 RepID=UPI001FDFC08E|nr:tyrosine-type recombinase/integrase [Rhizobium leguminosarum]
MSADQLGRVLAVCDRASLAGRRDFAILMLMSRLGLRAKEVALLSLDDIDWHGGLVQVHGKGGRMAAMPLPQDVGAAIADYIVDGRPSSGSRIIFHRVDTPCTPFLTATPVILIARRALKRAEITGLRSHHAHIFRHTFATMAIRSGVSLTELAQVKTQRRSTRSSTPRVFDHLPGRGWEQAYEHDADIPRAISGAAPVPRLQTSQPGKPAAQIRRVCPRTEPTPHYCKARR